MRPALIVVALVSLAALVGPSAPLFADVSAPAPLVWRSDAGAAEREAANARKPLLVFFSAEWCMPCKEMLARSFGGAEVSALVARRFVPLLVDLTNEDPRSTAIRERYHVVSVPTLLVRRGKDVRLRLEAFAAPAELRAALERSLH